MAKKIVENKYFLNITKHTDNTKMDQMFSISTSVKCNANCKLNAKIVGSICEKCYSDTMHDRYKALAVNTKHNTDILTSSIIPMEYLPVINTQIFRFEAFGDLNNGIQFINYMNICRHNPNVTFSIWTKCPWIMADVFNQGYEKPENLIILVSSLMVNVVMPIEKFPFADHIFTVFTADYAIENNIHINCGNNQCIRCRRCYTKGNTEKYINEILKSDLPKFIKMGGKVN